MAPYTPHVLALLLGLSSTTVAAGLYPAASNVLQVDASSYSRLIEKSNHTSIVEFYAPWCGHCRNLAPAYERAATQLKGLANVASVNCDEEDNKMFCGQMGVQGFPTLKIVKPWKDGSKKKKPKVSDYQGPREADGIIEAVKEKINSHVTRVKDDDLKKFLSEHEDVPKAFFFSEKGLVPPLVKALAIDFLGSLSVAFVRHGDKDITKKYGVTKFPSAVLLPKGADEPILFEGGFNQPELVDFLSQAASPNPDATRMNFKKSKSGGKNKSKSGSKTKVPKKAGKVEDDGTPLESPGPAVTSDEKPVKVPVEPAEVITQLETENALQKACLHSHSSTCILAILPDGKSADATDTVISSLTGIAQKHRTRGAKLFPFYSVPGTNPGAKLLVDGLSLKTKASEIAVVAINAKRSWHSTFDDEELSQTNLEKWIDNIRFGEMKKSKLPEKLVTQAVKEAEKEVDGETQPSDPDTQDPRHEEL